MPLIYECLSMCILNINIKNFRGIIFLPHEITGTHLLITKCRMLNSKSVATIHWTMANHTQQSQSLCVSKINFNYVSCPNGDTDHEFQVKRLLHYLCFLSLTLILFFMPHYLPFFSKLSLFHAMGYFCIPKSV